MNDSLTYAAAVLRRCDELASFTDEKGRLTRCFGTPALREAGEAVRGWMETAGMTVRRDPIGNVIGRAGGSRAPTLLIGSHVDTVRDAGRYDGPLGVLVAVASLERLRDAGRSLPYAVEVLAFADEEGVRYGTGYLGSSVVAGCFDTADLARRDADGVTLAEAVRAFGGDPDRLVGAGRDPADLLGYYEVHIEQGPVLEAEAAPLGVVIGIAGQSRARITFTGEAGHAGTVPMALRHDALCAAAEFVGAVEAAARSVNIPPAVLPDMWEKLQVGAAGEGLVATVGELEVLPGSSNVIPGRVVLSLDVRHTDDSVRESVATQLRQRAGEIADARGARLDWQVLQNTQAIDCSPELTQRLVEAVEASGCPAVRLPSGAGHDAVMLSAITPVTMLFVRCAGGVSHNPAESVTVEDVAAAIDVTTRFLERLG